MLGRLLQNSDVKKAIGLTPEQTQKAQQCVQRVMARHKDEFERARSQGQMPELKRKIAEEMARALEQAKILQPAQMSRLLQIARQQQGARALVAPDVISALKLTEPQVASIRSILEETGEKVGALLQGIQGKPDEGTRQKVSVIRKETLERTAAILSAEQQTAWNDLRGELVEVHFERGQRGGRQRGRAEQDDEL